MKKASKTKLRLIPVKVDDWDEDQIQRKADRHANGNRSAWIRYASRMYVPKKGERVPGRA